MVAHSIVSKIRKLLALSTSSNVNEAASAWAKAQSMLMEYNLSMDQVNTQEQKGREYLRYDANVGGNQVWKRYIADAVCRYNLCSAVAIRGTGRIAIIGEKHNIEVCELLIKTIIEQLESLASTAYKASGSSMRAITWKDAFYMGANRTINERFEAEKAQAANNIKALIVVRDKELVQATLKHFGTSVRSGGTKRVRGADAYNAGVQAGHQVRFRKEIA